MNRLRAACAGLVLSLTAGAASAEPVDVTIIEIEGTLADSPSPFDWLSGGAATTLEDHVNLIDRAAARRGVEEIFIRFKDAQLGVTQVEELADAVARARAAGKRVRFFAENYGTAELLLGAAANEAIIQQGGGVSFPGMSIDQMYFADTLSWIGVKADMIQVGDYKGANETMTRSAPSEAWSRNLNHLLDGLYGNMVAHLSEGRSLTGPRLDKALKEAWWAQGGQAAQLGLLDAEVDLADLEDHLSTLNQGNDIAWAEQESGESALSMDNPFALLRMLSESPAHAPSGPTIAVLHIDGTIVDGESSSGGLFGGSSTGSRTIRNAIEDILVEDDIGGVIVRIDSPGGSAIASEVIWQGLERLSAEKPVWVSVGSMAASGGYYCAVGGSKIYVNPSSIVGSIGVVGGKYSMEGLYDLLRINVHSVRRGPRADMFDTNSAWNDEQRNLVRTKMTETYDLFTSRVAAGRPGIDLSRTAEGRLFTGSQAIDMKMADVVGSLHDAVADLAKDVGYRQYDVLHYPGPKSLAELAEEMFKGFVAAPNLRSAPLGKAGELASMLEAALGPQVWSGVRAQLESMALFAREPVLVVMPGVIVVR